MLSLIIRTNKLPKNDDNDDELFYLYEKCLVNMLLAFLWIYSCAGDIIYI